MNPRAETKFGAFAPRAAADAASTSVRRAGEADSGTEPALWKNLPDDQDDPGHEGAR